MLKWHRDRPGARSTIPRHDDIHSRRADFGRRLASVRNLLHREDWSLVACMAWRRNRNIRNGARQTFVVT